MHVVLHALFVAADGFEGAGLVDYFLVVALFIALIGKVNTAGNDVGLPGFHSTGAAQAPHVIADDEGKVGLNGVLRFEAGEVRLLMGCVFGGVFRGQERGF